MGIWAVTFGSARRGLGGAAARPGPQVPLKGKVKEAILRRSVGRVLISLSRAVERT